MKAFKNRNIDKSKPVYVYRNLGNKSKGKYSIQQNGLVVAHSDFLTLENVQMVVSEAGRQRVLKNGVKNVHAKLKGYLSKKGVDKTNILCYNPYKRKQFFDKNTKKNIRQANFVNLSDKVYYE